MPRVRSQPRTPCSSERCLISPPSFISSSHLSIPKAFAFKALAETFTFKPRPCLPCCSASTGISNMSRTLTSPPTAASSAHPASSCLHLPSPSRTPPSRPSVTRSTRTPTATPRRTGPSSAGSARSTSSPYPASMPSSSSAATTSPSTRRSSRWAIRTRKSAAGSPTPPTRTGSGWATCAASSSPSRSS